MILEDYIKNLTDALTIIRNKSLETQDDPYQLFLACGFEPLHMLTFLNAYMLSRFPAISVDHGVYDDLLGNMGRAFKSPCQDVVILIEWSDLDPRLGVRRLGGWNPADLESISATVKQSLKAVLDSLRVMYDKKHIAISLPTLPLPPLYYTHPAQADMFISTWQQYIDEFKIAVIKDLNISVVSQQYIDSHSPFNERYSFDSDVRFGYSYANKHASIMAYVMVELLYPKMPKKGLITDLDNTMWKGVVGEDGWEYVSWDIEHNSHIHGLYQQFLQSLADAGVLLAVASKNDVVVVDNALNRNDLILDKDSLFPVKADWGRKSDSITEIMRTWNISADSIVFVDDNLAELGEVGMVLPDIECVHFPQEYDAFYQMLYKLRSFFGKSSIMMEDQLRRSSLKNAGVASRVKEDYALTLDEYLAQMEARIEIDSDKRCKDTRAFELTNKTNQFNLNGHRYTEQEWKDCLAHERACLYVVSYSDKYGPLGRISVMIGMFEKECLHLQSWVLSCRAFARRVEDQCLAYLFHKYPIEKIVFDFRLTERNHLVKEFLAQYDVDTGNAYPFLTRDMFDKKCPALSHEVVEVGKAYE